MAPRKKVDIISQEIQELMFNFDEEDREERITGITGNTIALEEGIQNDFSDQPEKDLTSLFSM